MAEASRTTGYDRVREILDKHGALGAKALHDVFIVHDLVIDVDRGAKDLDGQFESLDGHVHACTETARAG